MSSNGARDRGADAALIAEQRLDDPDEGVLEEQLVVLGDHLEHVIVPGLGKCRKSKHRENDHDTAGYRPPANPSGRHKGSSRNKLYSVKGPNITSDRTQTGPLTVTHVTGIDRRHPKVPGKKRGRGEALEPCGL